MVLPRERNGSKTHKIRDFGVSCMRPATDSGNESGLGLQVARQTLCLGDLTQ